MFFKLSAAAEKEKNRIQTVKMGLVEKGKYKYISTLAINVDSRSCKMAEWKNAIKINEDWQNGVKNILYIITDLVINYFVSFL